MREVPWDPEAVCDSCGAVGAYDFMGDIYCFDCLEDLVEEVDEDEFREEDSYGY